MVKDLPIVSSETALSVREEMMSSEAYIVELIARIERDNPNVFDFIAHFVATSNVNSPGFPVACSAFVYRLLESQAESDEIQSL